VGIKSINHESGVLAKEAQHKKNDKQIESFVRKYEENNQLHELKVSRGIRSSA